MRPGQQIDRKVQQRLSPAAVRLSWTARTSSFDFAVLHATHPSGHRVARCSAETVRRGRPLESPWNYSVRNGLRRSEASAAWNRILCRQRQSAVGAAAFVYHSCLMPQSPGTVILVARHFPRNCSSPLCAWLGLQAHAQNGLKPRDDDTAPSDGESNDDDSANAAPKYSSSDLRSAASATSAVDAFLTRPQRQRSSGAPGAPPPGILIPKCLFARISDSGLPGALHDALRWTVSFRPAGKRRQMTTTGRSPGSRSQRGRDRRRARLPSTALMRDGAPR